MTRRSIPGRRLAIFAVGAALSLGQLSARGGAEPPMGALPAPALDVTTSGPGLQTAIFSGGCFWGVQGVFEHVKGVTQAVSGYTGGHVVNPSYEQVSTGTTGDAESVRVTFDPRQVTYGRLLQYLLLGCTRSDRNRSSGPGLGHAVPLGAVRGGAGARTRGPSLHR